MANNLWRMGMILNGYCFFLLLVLFCHDCLFYDFTNLLPVMSVMLQVFDLVWNFCYTLSRTI